MSFVYRESLGRPLTFEELDDNFRQVDSLVSGASAELGNASEKANAAALSASNAEFSASQAQISANAAAGSVAPLQPLIQTGSPSVGSGAVPYDGSQAYPVGSAGRAIREVEALEYQDGTPLTVSFAAQVIVRSDNRYYAKLPTSFPVQLTGTWASDSDLLVSYADSSSSNEASNVSFTYPNGTIGTVQDLADAVKGAAMIGFKAAGAAAVARSLATKYEIEGRYRQYLTDHMTDAMISASVAGDYTVDTLPAWTAAQNALPLDGGVIILPGGTLGLSAEFTFRHGVTAIGTGGMYSTNGTSPGNTVIVPRHAGRSCLSFQGANGCEPKGFTIKSYPDLFPKVGYVLGRSTPASAGQHHFEDVSVLGHYSVAGIYSVASEDILLTKSYVWIFGGGAKYCFATGISDSLGVGGGLVASSNLHITMLHPFFINSSTDPDAAPMYFECAQATGNVTVIGGYLIAASGSYIHMNMGAVDGQSPIGTWTFCGVNGERLSGGDPRWGFRVTATGTQTLKGLSISGGRFDLLASDVNQHWDILIPGNAILDAYDIKLPQPEAFPYATSQLNRSQLHGGTAVVGRFAIWAAVAFQSGWTNTFGAPRAPAGYRISPDNKTQLRGTLNGTTSGTTAFFLPTEYRPPYDMSFPATAGTSPVAARVDIIAATGAVVITSSQITQVDISNISFDLSL